MFDPLKPVPDVLASGDKAVRLCTPPVDVWVNLSVVFESHEHTKRYRRNDGGIYLSGSAYGSMWAQVMTHTGAWAGLVSFVMERQGQPVMATTMLVPEWAIRRRRPGEFRGSRTGPER